MFVLKHSEDYSRATVMVQSASVGLAVLCTRTIWFSLLQRAIATGLVDARRVILIGDAAHCLHFSARVMATGIRTVRSFELPTASADSAAHARPNTVQALPDARQLIADCRPLRADDIIILISQQDIPSSLALASDLSELPVDVHVVPVGTLELMAMSRITQFGNMVTMRILQSPLTPFRRAFKRGFDVAAAIVGLILLSPPLRGRCTRNQARFAWAGAVSADAARLQQRAHSRTKISLNDGDGGRRQLHTSHKVRSACDQVGTSYAAPISMSCHSCSMSWPATCRSSVPVHMQSHKTRRSPS
jgi:CoA-binding domain